MTFYVCNGKKEGCSESSVCRKKGGCFHTTDEFFALYDEHTEFDFAYHRNEEPQMWEKIKET